MFFSTLSALCWAKNCWSIYKNLAHFAHRFFSTQEKFAHWSKNPGCATVVIHIPIQKKYYFTIINIKKYFHHDRHPIVFVHIVHWALLRHL
jgi:hypothetical protein